MIGGCVLLVLIAVTGIDRVWVRYASRYELRRHSDNHNGKLGSEIG
jgi:hypothetical protein